MRKWLLRKRTVPTGQGDLAGAASAFVALPQATPGMNRHFTAFWQAAQGWDGREPVRPFI